MVSTSTIAVHESVGAFKMNALKLFATLIKGEMLHFKGSNMLTSVYSTPRTSLHLLCRTDKRPAFRWGRSTAAVPSVRPRRRTPARASGPPGAVWRAPATTWCAGARRADRAWSTATCRGCPVSRDLSGASAVRATCGTLWLSTHS